MPVLTQGSSATLTFADSDSVTIQAGSGVATFESPTGTVVAVFSGSRTFGPLSNTTGKVTATVQDVYYEFADGTGPVFPLLYQSGATPTLPSGSAGAVASLNGGILVPSAKTSSVQAQLSGAVTNGGKTVQLDYRKNGYTYDGTDLTADLSYASIEGNRATLDFSTANTAGFSLNLTGTQDPPYGQEQSFVRNLTLKGPGKGNAAQRSGIRLTGQGNVGNGRAGSNRAIIGPIVSSDWATGWQLNSNAYGYLLLNTSTYNCGTAWFWQDGQFDSGERITKIGGFTYQCDVAERSDGNQGLGVFNIAHSVDYCGVVHNLRTGTGGGKQGIYYVGCWLEAGDYATAMMTQSGTITGYGEAFVPISSTQMVLTGIKATTQQTINGTTYNVGDILPRTMQYFFTGATGGEPVYTLDNVKLQNMQTTTKRYGGGTAIVHVTGPVHSTRDKGAPALLSSRDDQNGLLNGHFLGNIGDGDITFILSDGANAITNPYTGTNGANTHDGTILDPNDTTPGAQTYKVLKSASATTVGTYQVVVAAMPIRKSFLKGGLEVRYRRGAGTGNVVLKLYYANLRQQGSENLFKVKGPAATALRAVENPTQTLTDAGTPLFHVMDTTNYPIGTWATVQVFDSYRQYPRESDTHLLLVADMDAASSGSFINLANCWMNEA